MCFSFRSRMGNCCCGAGAMGVQTHLEGHAITGIHPALQLAQNGGRTADPQGTVGAKKP